MCNGHIQAPIQDKSMRLVASAIGSSRTIFPSCVNLLYLSLLTPVASPNPLLYQSLPTSIHNRHAKLRRRKDDPYMGTAARGIIERLSRVPRRVHLHGGASGRLRCALSTGAGDRGWPAPH